MGSEVHRVAFDYSMQLTNHDTFWDGSRLIKLSLESILLYTLNLKTAVHAAKTWISTAGCYPVIQLTCNVRSIWRANYIVLLYRVSCSSGIDSWDPTVSMQLGQHMLQIEIRIVQPNYVASLVWEQQNLDRWKSLLSICSSNYILWAVTRSQKNTGH